jgi:phosphoribosyl 1,2-cyclic phosphodiesterase
VKLRLWGTRGSLAAPGPETLRYGGNTSCVEVTANGTRLILDAGTGIRRLGAAIGPEDGRVDVLLTHLHLDHILGLGFFQPLDQPGQEVHVWGPPSTTLDLHARLSRYFSPPLFPVRLRELACELVLHDIPGGEFAIGGLTIRADLVCHPGSTVGYRIGDGAASIAYLPDHEPALGANGFPTDATWTSGLDLAAGVDLLIHDAQYTEGEYASRVGWGHSAIPHALGFARMARVKRLVTFHHDPSHDDVMLDRLIADSTESARLPFELIPGKEGEAFEI